MQIKEESPAKEMNSLPISQIQQDNYQKTTFQSNNSPNPQNFRNLKNENSNLNNPSMISQNPSLGGINPSFSLKNNNSNNLPNNIPNNTQNNTQNTQNNPMMQMMANMMAAQSQGQMGNMNQMMMTQFQSFMKQNPQFMMEQMKMMQMHMNPNQEMNTQSTQEIGGRNGFGNQNQNHKSISMTNLQKNNANAAKNLNKLRAKEKQKINNKIVGTFFYQIIKRRKARTQTGYYGRNLQIIFKIK